MTPTRKSEEYTRHVKGQGRPLPVCISCMLHGNVLKKESVDKLHALGMLIAKRNSAMLVIFRVCDGNTFVTKSILIRKI